MTKGDSAFLSGMVVGIITVLGILLFALGLPATRIDTVGFEGHEALEYLEIRVLMDDAIDVGEAVHFATTDGYFIYHDGVLYQEVK